MKTLRLFLKRMKAEKSYLILIILLSIFIVVGYASYAMFTVNKEQKEAIRIITGDLTPTLMSEDKDFRDNKITVSKGSKKVITITLTNNKSRNARVNFYYVNNIDKEVSVRYQGESKDTPPEEKGIIVNKDESRSYTIAIDNPTNEDITVEFKADGGLENKALDFPSNGHIIDGPLPNAPVLSDNMIPVVYDTTQSRWEKANINNNWYNYDNQEWANAVTVEDKEVVDQSNSNHNGKLRGNIQLGGDGITLDGVDDYVDCGYANYDFGNQVTYILRFKFNQPVITGVDIFGNWENAGGGFQAYKNYLEFNLYIDSAYQLVRSSYAPEPNVYYTLVATYNGEKLKLYINGELAQEKNISGNIKTSPMSFFVGVNLNSNGLQTAPSNISVTNAMILNKSIDETEVKESYSGVITKKETDALFNYDFSDFRKIRKEYQEATTGEEVKMEDILQMFVWIPRYSYTIKSEDGVNYYGKKEVGRSDAPTKELPGEIDVKFISTSTTDNGSAQYINNEIENWYTPPGFKFGEKNLSGIWIGKFEPGAIHGSSPGDTEIDNFVAIKPNITSWQNIRISTLELVSMGITKINNIYGFNQSTYDSHAMKNSEWALMSYLTQSKYGKYGNPLYTGENKQVYMNNCNLSITGCSSGLKVVTSVKECTYQYNDLTIEDKGKGYAGGGASSTGNVTGIYDINGGAWEYTMGVLNKMSGNTVTANSGYKGQITDGSTIEGREWPSEKYYDVYTTTDTKLACNGGPCKGHALNETAGWNSNGAWGATVKKPWFNRSGVFSDPNVAGIFYHSSHDGSAAGRASFRVVLTPNN